ncbi:hypothetical protein TGRH88_070870 [Toxoplasma gondii]|uniref:Uncharacterized protein n=1 Tax=Toxoplasma gondii TaxID=5811 RepID=A0A7J6K2P7_TOXGO|nr:hypothetical protein TGRH88_070870 [Toxoplasma gondii]
MSAAAAAKTAAAAAVLAAFSGTSRGFGSVFLAPTVVPPSAQTLSVSPRGVVTETPEELDECQAPRTLQVAVSALAPVEKVRFFLSANSAAAALRARASGLLRIAGALKLPALAAELDVPVFFSFVEAANAAAAETVFPRGRRAFGRCGGTLVELDGAEGLCAEQRLLSERGFTFDVNCADTPSLSMGQPSGVVVGLFS